MAALETLGIPEELATFLLNLQLNKLGTPVWKVQKGRNGYNVSIFWRNAEAGGTTPFSAHGEVSNRRKQRSQRRLEAFIERKKEMKESASRGKVSDAGNPADNHSNATARCETPPSSCPDAPQQKQLSLTPHPAVDSVDIPITSLVAQDVEKVDPDTLMADGSSVQVIDLSTCSSVVYEEIDSVPGVKYVAANSEGWTPVVKRNLKERTVDKGDGSRRNPTRAKDEVLQLDYAKDIRFAQVNGTPGLTYRRGKTNHSFEWMPIIPGSPVATRTRTKLKS